jgi:pilus assembly protein FimV
VAHKNALVGRKAALALAVALTFGVSAAPETARAAGLGPLTVQSALGQPLKAEVEVTSVTPEELQSLSVRLAPQAAFRQAGIEFNPALASLRFSLDKSNGRHIVRITSTQAINEPFVDLLLELNWATGRLVREYTFLLDPPELRIGKAPDPIAPVVVDQTPASASVTAPKPSPTPEPTVKTGPAPAPAPAPSATSAPKPDTSSSSASEVKVKSGDTLSKIAVRNLPSGVTLEQMLVALYRANPNAFAGSNMNRLKAGTILRLPEATDAMAVPAPDARREVVVQAKDFSSFRGNLASAVAKAAPSVAVVPESKSAQGQVTAKVDDKAAPKADSKDQVKLARPQSSSAQTGATGGGTTTAAQADAALAKEKALKEAKQRVAELERNVSEMQKLMAKQNEALAKAQEATKNKPATPSAPVPPTPAPVVKAEPPKAEAPKAEPPKAEAPKAEPPKAEAPKAEPPKAEAPKAEPPKTEPAKAAPPKKEPPKTPAPPAEDKDILSALLQNPLVLGGVALFLALIGGGLAWYRRRQAKKLVKFQDSILAGDDLKSNSIFGATGGKSVDTNDSTFNSSFTPSASQIDSNEVDPIAEADVYIAYGRDTQAEEILKEALKVTPDRHAIRVKLLEIYANRKDLGSFSSLAGELYQQTNGDGEDWARASELGRSIDPRNPLYGAQGDSSRQTQILPTMAEPRLDDFRTTLSSAPIPVDFDLHANTQPTPVPIAERTTSLSGSGSADISSGRAQNMSMQEPRLSAANTSLGATQPSGALDFNLGQLPASDVKAPSIEPKEPAKVSLEFDLNLPSSSVSSVNIPAQDLSSISLDLDSGKPAASPAGFESIAADPADARQQEMATKLDLAAAYQEIGDREGAKELLEEVVRGGDPQQQSRAQKLLEGIA